MRFGDFIELVLWYKHVSKADLAKLLNTSTASVDRIVHASIKLPPAKMLKLSKILDVPPEVLFMWQGFDLSQRYKDND